MNFGLWELKDDIQERQEESENENENMMDLPFDRNEKELPEVYFGSRRRNKKRRIVNVVSIKNIRINNS